ncbi:MAG: CDP-alcohol phosphatidyltransferase family protein [Halobacteriota archaeon]
MNATGGTPVLSRLKDSVDRLLSRPANLLVGLGVTPNMLTLAGLAIGVFAGIVLALGFFAAGGVLILVTGFVDMLDGAVARNRRAATTFGATFDSISDRYVDCIVLLGLGIAGVNWIYVGAALMGSLLVSYVRAKGEGMGFHCTAGVAERSERLIILAIGLLVGLAEPAVLLVAILAQFTALWRVGLLLRRATH